MTARDRPRGAARLAAVLAAALAALAAAPYATAETAAEGERAPPVEIESDEAELDNVTGIGIYTGDVIMTRGAMRLTGDRMEVHMREDRTLDRVYVDGEPATFYDFPEHQDHPVEAEAPRMEYYTAGPERIYLLGGGRMWQRDDEFEGDTITIDLEREVVEARSDAAGERRTRTIIYPGRRDEGQ